MEQHPHGLISLFLNDFLTRALLLCALDRFTVHITPMCIPGA
jgi:hypothetical protein